MPEDVVEAPLWVDRSMPNMMLEDEGTVLTSHRLLECLLVWAKKELELEPHVECQL